jgi:hypothetical protein
MSIIPRSKFGNCSECGDENVNVVKNGKNLYCIPCRNLQKAKKYTEKANLKSKIRGLISNEGMAERQSLINDLDFTFSRYIRIRESNPKGMCECYTCGKIDQWKYLQCGHYIKRSDTLLRWDSRNARSQCIECNCNLHGNIEEYTKRLNEEQPGLPEQLREESREVYKYSREELKQLLIDYRAKLKIVESKLIS